MNTVVRSTLTRLVSFLPAAVATLLASRLIIGDYGLDTFNAFALVLALINLVPLNNLGVGAAVTAAAAAEGTDTERTSRTLLTATRVLAVSSVITAAVALGLTAIGAWPTLLGSSSGPNFWSGLALLAFAVSFVPGLGQSILLGQHRNHVAVAVSGLFAPLIVVGVVLVQLTGVTGDLIVVVPSLAVIAVNLVMSMVSVRGTSLSWWAIVRRVPRPRRYAGQSIRALSGPMLLITLSTPIALQSDRIVLSQVSDSQAVANYSVMLQIIAPGLGLVAAAAQPLWPIWVEARTRGERGPAIGRVLLLFCGAAAVIGTVLALLSAPIASLIGGDKIDLGLLLPFAGALSVVTAAASYPVAMCMMDASGARVVAWLSVVALPINVAVSVVLAEHLGAAGPLLGSCIVGLTVQAIPGWLYSRDRQSPARHRRGRSGPPPLTGSRPDPGPVLRPRPQPRPRPMPVAPVVTMGDDTELVASPVLVKEIRP